MISNLSSYPSYKATRVEWLKCIPEHWGMRRLKSVCLQAALYGANVSAGFYSDKGVRFLRTTDITDDGELNPSGVYLPENLVRDYLLADGDLLISRSGTVGRSFLFDTKRHGRCAYAGYLVRFVPSREILPEYLFWFTKTQAFYEFLRVVAISSTIENVNGEKYANAPLPLPLLTEQHRIVRFLDRADRRIQRYIRAKQRLIALLEEQKQALIHEAVTGRIDVRTGRPYPAYKESGVEWLGTVPAHWEIWRSKRTFRPRTELARPGDTQLSATQAYGVIAQADYEEKIGRKVTRILRHLDQRRHVEIDDFVISMRSFQGGLERAWTSGCIRSSYIVLHAATELIVGYFAYLFKSFGYIGALQSTANFIRDGQDLNFENFCRVDVAFPPIDEQQHIAQAVDRGTDHIAASIERSRRQIGSLCEYRARLVADVVTGKVDVRKAAAGLSETVSLGAEDDPDVSIDHDTDRLETTTGS